MNASLKILIVLLLLFNGTGALFGGGQLILHPDGSSLGLTMELLRHSPFHDYLVPGIVLFFANGLFSFFVIATMLMNFKHYLRFIIGQGVILCGWIVIQMAMIRVIYQLHIVFGSAGLLLILFGFLLKMLERSAEAGRKELSLSKGYSSSSKT